MRCRYQKILFVVVKIEMSLFIVGSVSRVTSNIVLELARNKIFTAITIADLLPDYQFHHRFYRLQKQLDNLQLSQGLKLNKIHQINDIYEGEKTHQHLLYVTHDYYQHVTSKTRLMEITAQACKKRNNAVFATPIEYDHFGFENPQSNYLKSQDKVRQIAPNSTIIRSDVQDSTQAMAFINSSKTFLKQHTFNFYSSKHFAPRVVSGHHYAKIVADSLRQNVQGKKIVVRGKSQKKPYEVNYDIGVQQLQYEHAQMNIAQMTSKYKGINGDYESIESQ